MSKKRGVSLLTLIMKHPVVAWSVTWSLILYVLRWNFRKSLVNTAWRLRLQSMWANHSDGEFYSINVNGIRLVKIDLPDCRITQIRISRLLLQWELTLTDLPFPPYICARIALWYSWGSRTACAIRPDGVSLHFDDVPPSDGLLRHLLYCLFQIEEVNLGKFGS